MFAGSVGPRRLEDKLERRVSKEATDGSPSSTEPLRLPKSRLSLKLSRLRSSATCDCLRPCSSPCSVSSMAGLGSGVVRTEWLLLTLEDDDDIT